MSFFKLCLQRLASLHDVCRANKELSLHWRHNGHDSVSNHQPHDCLLNRLFRRRSKKYQSSTSLAFVRGIHRRPVNSPHKWPVMRKMFPFDDVIMMREIAPVISRDELWSKVVNDEFGLSKRILGGGVYIHTNLWRSCSNCKNIMLLRR